jgi:hypothetical protein
MHGIFKTQEELFKALEELGKKVREKGYDGRMSDEALMKSGAVNDTPMHEGEGIIIVNLGRKRWRKKD